MLGVVLVLILCFLCLALFVAVRIVYLSFMADNKKLWKELRSLIREALFLKDGGDK